MSFKEIYTNLGLETNIKLERSKFNYRLYYIYSDLSDYVYEHDFLREILYQLGQPYDTYSLSGLVKVTDKEEDLVANLLVVQITIDILFKKRDNFQLEPVYQMFLEKIRESFNLSMLEIGYVVEGNLIIKIDAKELDTQLIIDNLSWLKNFPSIKTSYNNSIEFLLSKKYLDCITNSYSALEGMVKILLQSNSRLDNPKTITSFLEYLNFDKEWAALIFNYCKIAQEYSSRHGKKTEIKEQDLAIKARFFVYLTGSFLYLIKNAKK